jgi:uncharacterized protein YjbI with pentapeptide repeats
MLDETREETVSQASNGEPDTKEAEALAAALNHSAERAQTLWFSFLTFMLYLAVATGTTTHRMLFLQSPLNLPVLNIALPLLGFYILTPVIFVVFHFYMLLNLVLLARTARTFEGALQSAFPKDENEKARENFRMRIENTLFVQLLVGAKLEREGLNARLLSLMALITLALAPVALMLMFEVKFLPYHSEWITWLHRGLLALDLALVWTLWPGYRSGWGVRIWPKRSWWLVVPGVLSAVTLVYAVAVATFPDEPIYLATNWLPGSTQDAVTSDMASSDTPNWYALIAPVNTLALRGEDLIDDAKLKKIIEKNESATGEPRWAATLPLVGRDLTGADLFSADVRHVDFSHAILNRANLIFALAEEAHFHQTHLQGTSLDAAHLQGALLVGAQLQGASLDAAQLQGALLDGAQLQGAALDAAQLQGADLDGAELQGASFVHVCAWRADARQAAWENTSVELPTADTIHECDWTAASFAALKRLIAEEVPEVSNIKHLATERIEQWLDPTKALAGEDEMAKIWAARERESPTPATYEKSLAGLWSKLGCAAEGAPYVLHALIDRLSPWSSPFRDQSDAAKDLASAFLDEAHCAGAHGLSEADKAKLKEIAARAAPQAPKP